MNTEFLNCVQSVKEVPAIKENQHSKKSYEDTSKNFQGELEKASNEKICKSKENSKLNKKEVNKSDNNAVKKDLSEISKAKDKENDKEVVELDSEIENKNELESNNDKLMEMLKKMLNGELPFNLEIIKKAIENFNQQDNTLLDIKECSKLQKDIIEVLSKNFNIDLENLKGNSLEKNLELLVNLNIVKNQDDDVLKTKILEELKAKLNSLNENEEKFSISEPQEGINLKNQFDLNKNSKENSSSPNNFNGDSSNFENIEENLLQKIVSGEDKKENTSFEKAINYVNSMSKIDKINPSLGISSKVVGEINAHTFVEDIIKDVKFMQQNNMKEMTVKINPKELGELLIRLTMEDGIMKANIKAQNKETYSILNNNYNELNSKLSEEGIKIQKFTIDIYNGDTTFFSEEKNKKQNQTFKGNDNSKYSLSDEENNDDYEKKIESIDNRSINTFV